MIQMQISPYLICPNFQYVLDVKPIPVDEKVDENEMIAKSNTLVSEILSLDDEYDDSSMNSVASLWKATPRFLSRATGCDGRRAYGIVNRKKDQVIVSEKTELLLEVTIDHGYDWEELIGGNNTSSALNGRRKKCITGHHGNYDEDLQLAGVQLVGGWACGKEAVKLTEPIYFVPRFSNHHENKDEKKVPFDEL
jgi:hypothetical protein